MREKSVVRAALAMLVLGATAPAAVSAATFEAESLTVTNSGTGTSVQTDSNASGGQWISLNATGTGSWMEFTLPSVAAGTYTVKMKYKTNNNRGQLALRVDGTQVGGTLDQYQALPSVYPETTFGTVTLGSGSHLVRLTVTGKNAASSSYVLSADIFTLEGSATPAPTPTPTPTPSSGGSNGGTWEAESLAPTASGASTAMQNEAGASGGTWLALLADGAGDYMQFTTPSLNSGTYSLTLAYKAHPGRGTLQASVDGANVGSPLDQYAATAGVTSRNLGSVSVGAGVHTIRLTVTGRNGSSTAYTISADTITLSAGTSPTATPTPTPTTTGPTPTPQPTATPQSGWTLKWTADPSRGMATFEGVEDDRAGSHTSFGNHIRVESGGIFQWYMHMVDRDGSDRQRHETKGMNEAGTDIKMLQGEVWKFVYEMFMPTSLTGGSKFTHIHQMKMVSDAGSSGTPLSTLSTSLSGSTETLVMRSLNGGTNFNPIPLAPRRGHWIEVELEYKIGNGGYARMAVRDGGQTITDATMQNVNMWYDEGTCCRYARPKWGIYRSLESAGLKDTYLQIRNLRAYKK
jgi:hypothetical protein